MISAQTLRVCREGKPVSTFPDHALAEFGIERGRPQRHVGAIPQGHRHLSGFAVDLDVTEELHAGDGGRFCLSRPGALMNLTSGPKVLSSSLGPNVPRPAVRRRTPRTGRNPGIAPCRGCSNARRHNAHPPSAKTVLVTPDVLMKRSRSAISSSRPRGGPSPCANASEPFLLGASS